MEIENSFVNNNVSNNFSYIDPTNYVALVNGYRANDFN